MQTTVGESALYAGASMRVRWERDGRNLVRCRKEGQAAAERYPSIAVTQMSALPVTLMTSKAFDSNVSPIFVKECRNLTAVYAFCSDQKYRSAVKRLEPSMKANNSTLLEVSFDLAHWTRVAAERYPNGLPEPYSDDPTQWLFHGHPAQAEAGTQLHVALARLAGYRWPAESDPAMRLSAEARAWIARAAAPPDADADGMLCLPAVAGARPLANRLREYLNLTIPGWDEGRLLREADERFDKKPGRDLSLEAWLRERAFRQHCALFHNRPFLWHVWDGQRDGFSAFINYNRLDTGVLRKLTYTVLGDWKRRIEAEPRLAEAAGILGRKLELILDGEAPHDIFVRWKPLARQPLGWEPDLNDGVRLNIRPWVEADVLREPAPKGIKWGVDRGADVAPAPWFAQDQGKRNNDRHTTLAEKRAARAAASAAKAAE